jgi:LCP family protein required for cell wall assembly
MNDQFSAWTDPDSEPTLPHMPRVPAPDDEDDAFAPTRPGSPPTAPQSGFDGATIPSPVPPVQGGYGPRPSPYAPPHNGPSYGSTPYSESAARERDRRRRVRTRKRRGSDWAWVIVAMALFGVTLVISLSVFVVLRSSRDANQTAEENGMVAAQATAMIIVPTTVSNLDSGSSGTAPTSEPQNDMGSVAIEPWDGHERFTILLMGWDRRPGDSPDAAYRTDTMMLVSLDPRTNSVGVLSIPRDLYVNVPGYSELQRVNSAYVLGELRQPGYGPQLTMETVQYNLGIRVHDYVIVDFNAFTTVIDAIGGIDVDVPYNISDSQYPDMYYGYDPFYITAGPHHLDGATALKYARTRHGSSDFRRAERQQQVVFAIRDKVLSVGNLPQLVVRAPTIWASIREGVRTGLSLDQLLRLAWYAKDIPSENIHTGVIDEQYISFYTTPSGASVVVPNRYRLGSLMVQVFGENYNE